MRKKKLSFINFIYSRIDFYKSINKNQRAERYFRALCKLHSFTEGKDLYFDDLTVDTMLRFESFCEQQGNCPNTISYYNRIIRALYNQAVEEELIEDNRPFRKSYCGIAKTVKRAIPLSKIKEIANLDLSSNYRLRYARDLFMFSFYTRGMSFVDMAFLKKDDLKNGVLSYRRHKTGQLLHIKWEKPMERIRERIGGSEKSPYLLDIIRWNAKDERKAYKNAMFHVNESLHKIQGMVKLGIPLTMYVARHSWASACKMNNIPISVISEGMGHDSEETTRIYLASLDTSIVDKANKKIIDKVIS